TNNCSTQSAMTHHGECAPLSKVPRKRSVCIPSSVPCGDSEAVLQHKRRLKAKFQFISNDVLRQDHAASLNDVYTELYIIESDRSNVNNEHEVRQIEIISRTHTAVEIPIKCNDIFSSLNASSKAIHSVMTKGIAGIGKTVSVQKFVLDWAEARANQDMEFIYPLAFRELNLMKEKQFSLVELLQYFRMEIPQRGDFQDHKVLFIFDGLDESRFALDFQNNERVCDATMRVSLDVLVTNLIGGTLLPSALLWITSRPAAANQIPPQFVDLVTEVRGFNDPQKVEYLKKKINDQSLACRIITHIKSSRSLFIMCHIPVFCWLTATVLETLLGSSEAGEIPKTLTQMYIHFLLIQTRAKQRYFDRCEDGLADEDMIVKLGKLAFEQLEKGNIIFYEEDLRACGIDFKEAVIYSGVCSQIFKEEHAMTQSKVYCFLHLSIQEFLAAVYVFVMCNVNNWNVLDEKSCIMVDLSRPALCELHRSAVDRALKSENGNLDLFLRFLLGLSLDSNQTLLQGLLTKVQYNFQSLEASVDYIKKKIEENSSTEKSINLFHCLNELNELSLVKDIQHYLSSEWFSKFSLMQWSALVFVLLTSADRLNIFDLKKYSKSDEGLLRLLLVVKASEIALLSYGLLTEKCCEALATAFRSYSSVLKAVDLSGNLIEDTGVEWLSSGLQSPQCRLEILRLAFCGMTEKGASALASAFAANPAAIRELDLSENPIGDSGLKALSQVLENVKCRLQTLRLRETGVTGEGCVALASNPIHLRELNLGNNDLRGTGIKFLFAALEDHSSAILKLELNQCSLTTGCCDSLASALGKKSSCLRELNLGCNNLQDSGVKSLCAGLESPHCKLKTLSLSNCGVTEESCTILASVLSGKHAILKELDLSGNDLKDTNIRQLSALMENPDHKLEKIK
ncbi:hypothetical protein P4O66_022555, partial [Electrophorus voltai]